VIGSYAGAALVVAGFSWLLLRLGLVEQAREINVVLRTTAATVADRSLSDAQKERALQQQSKALFGRFARVTLGLLLALGVPILLVWLIGLTHLWSFEGAMAASISWPFLLAGLVLFVLVMVLGGRRRAG